MLSEGSPVWGKGVVLLFVSLFASRRKRLMSWDVNVCLSIGASSISSNLRVPVFWWMVVLFLKAVVLYFQGDIVNNIEQNVSKSVDHVTVAKEQTKKAIRYQTKARKVNCSSTFIARFLSVSFLFHSCATYLQNSFVTFQPLDVSTHHAPLQ